MARSAASTHLLNVRLIEQFEADGATGRLSPGLQTGVAARNTRHREERADLVVLGEHTIELATRMRRRESP